MKLCDTCIYRNNVEQLKPCIIYRNDCEYYEREEDMKAIIQIDVPNYQIGQEVSIYFKDTMVIKGIVQEPKTGHWKSFTHSAYHGIDDDGEPIWREVKVYHCNLCNRRTVIKENYCPNCGARMVEPQESEE